MPRRGKGVIAAATMVVLVTAGGSRADQDETNIGGRWRYLGGAAVDSSMERQRVPADRLPSPVLSGAKELGPGEPIWMQTGKNRVLQLPHPLKRISIGNPELAGVVVLGPRTVMINAKELPRDIGGARRGATRLQGGELSQVLTQTLTPPPRVAETSFAIWYGREENPDVHTLFVADFLDRQVLLEVTVAELDRTKFERWGIDFRAERSAFSMSFFNGGGVGPSPNEASSLITPLAGTLPLGTGADFPIFGFQAPKEGVAGLVEAMEQDGLIKILARPRLVAMSGQNALFQVGGEIPIRIATGFATDVEFKPFGTIINFVPRVSEEGDIMLTVTPEVSQPDFSSLVEGVPTFRTRRASTSARLRNGQTFVLGGLRQTVIRRTVGGLPYLKDIPALGWAFRHVQYDDEVTELLVVTTPYIVEPLPEGSRVPLPTDRRRQPAPPPPY